MLIRSLLVDFDGTACPHDVSEELLDRFGTSDWRRFDEAVDRGEMGLREGAERQAAMLDAPLEEMLEYAVANFRLDPTFPPFVAWAKTHELPLTLISDGFAFYIPALLEREGLGHLPVVTNVYDGRTLRHPNGHPICVGCGTCKMLGATRFRASHDTVAFVGEGQSDRYGALYSDLVFAKLGLVRICERDGVPYVPWETFDDVRRTLETIEALPGPVAPQRCPGWREPPPGRPRVAV